METKLVLDCKTATIEALKHAFTNRLPISGIDYLASHFGAHSDEMFSKFLLRTTPQGRSLFPGIEDAGFGPTSTTNLREHNMLGEEGFFRAMQRGILLLGVGNGAFDEHSNRKDQISCTELVSRHLGLRKEKGDRKIYGPLIEYVNFEDGNGDDIMRIFNRVTPDRKLSEKEKDATLKLRIGHFARHLKARWKVAGADLAKATSIYEFAFDFYASEVESAKLFIAAESDYEQAQKRVIPLRIPGSNKKLVILEVQSDNPSMGEVVHNKWRDNRDEKLAILFLRKSNGGFVLLPSHHVEPLQMREVVKILRDMVISKDRREPVQWAELAKPELIEAVPELHIFDNTGMISNGSLVDPDVPGLIRKKLLSADNVIDAIKFGLGEFEFPSQFKKGCEAGSCAKSHCFLYASGLQRCHDVRKNGNTAKNVIANKLDKVLAAN